MPRPTTLGHFTLAGLLLMGVSVAAYAVLGESEAPRVSVVEPPGAASLPPAVVARAVIAPTRVPVAPEPLQIEPPAVEDNGTGRDPTEPYRKEIERLKAELLFCQHPEDTAYGALLRLPETAALRKSQIVALETLLEVYPIKLQPGEATWLAGQAIDVPGLLWPVIPDATFIRFVGAPRIRHELTPEQFAAMREHLSELYAELFE